MTESSGFKPTQQDVDDLIRWLAVGLGYPYNGPMTTDPTFPTAWRLPLARHWYDTDGGGSSGDTLGDWFIAMAEEGDWTLEERSERCWHESMSGIDTTPSSDLVKLWQCHSCGIVATEAELCPAQSDPDD